MMTLQDILKHFFTEDDLAEDVISYTVEHTYNSDTYNVVAQDGKLCVTVIKNRV